MALRLHTGDHTHTGSEMSFELDYAKWIDKVAAYLRKNYNRDYKSLPYAFELRYFSGYSPKEVITEVENMFPDL